MADCDVLIVGGGPAGSSCAWHLRGRGLDVVVVDRAVFPRDKPCAGWVTPDVFRLLNLDPAEYGCSRTLQPIRRFLTGTIGGRAVETVYEQVVSWGIRRREFDHFLLERAGCRILEETPVVSLEPSADGWICNGSLSARVLVGAGGHFCPVARRLATPPSPEPIVATEEVEFRLDDAAKSRLLVEPDRPELYFCEDMKGYGWCFRKGPFLNVGLGRMDSNGLPRHVENFLDWLRRERGVPAQFGARLRGHAYLLRGRSLRPLVADRVVLAGDSAGLAASLSGEGIRPAVLSGILAAETILGCDGNYSAERLETYARLLAARLPVPGAGGASRLLPSGVLVAFGRVALANRRLTRRLILDRWFLGQS